MNQTAYVLVGIDRRTLRAVTAGIYSEKRPTQDFSYCLCDVFEVTSVSYGQAEQLARRQIKSSPHYAWLIPLLGPDWDKDRTGGVLTTGRSR